jgi:hypothetical protein
VVKYSVYNKSTYSIFTSLLGWRLCDW